MIRFSGLRALLSRRALLAGLAGAIVVALAAAGVVVVSARGGHSRPPVPAAARSDRTAVAAVTTETAAAVAAGGGGSQTAAPTPTPGGTTAEAVPWVNKPGTPQSVPVSASAGRPCRAADLDIAAGLTGAFQAMATQELTIRDHAADPCFLAGAPQVVLANAGARSRVNPGQFATKRLDLASGSSAGLVVGTPTTCAGSGQPVVAASVLLTLPTGDAVTVSGTQIDTECGAPTLVAFGAADVLPAASPGPLDSLSATVSAPQTAARGAVLTYQVTLVNQSTASVALSPCPSYTEVLGGGTGAVQQTLVLNCQAGASIAANASVTYDMKLTVPASAPPGDTKLTWKLEVPDGPVTGTVITVT